MKLGAFAALAAVAVAVPVAAQQPAARDTAHRMPMSHAMPAQAPAGAMQHGMMGRMGGMERGQAGMQRCSGMMGGMGHDSAMNGMMEGMMQAMGSAAEHVLAQKTALRLTPDQDRRIVGIRDAAKTAHDAAMADAMRHQRELDEVMRAAAPDTAAMKAHFDGAFAAMGQAHLAMLRSAALTRAVLTDAQRRQVDSLESAMGCGMMPARASAQPAHRH